MRFSTSARAIAAGCLLFCATNATSAPRMLAVDGGKLAYETCGAGPEAIVLLHDGILHSAAFDDAWPILCQRYRVVRYDRRGYGASPPAVGAYKPAEDLAAVMKAADMPHATLVGSSSGSGVAVDFALAHPEAVDRLVLVGPWVSGFDASYGFLARTLKLLVLFKLGAVNSAVKDPYILTKGATAERKRVADLLRAYPGNVTAGTKEQPLGVAKPRLGEIRAPTLVLVGAVDIKDVQEQARAIEAAVPGARRIIVPASGHLMYLERPKVFADHVIGFIGEHPR
ncbi:alpha/beta fold hydrolase [Caulobacter sp. 602-1]|uniref:alpha/beta fold hydrolase n=1 Tax=Caulobacter sp. 602-1 TaxID=2492472 RepID=UPI000F636C05|nr:alpha/beta hydrolase [Caulobacter sp. 602-1]RRN63927.1 alpha/beta hydrolase [Caulobacter sp. 602-1]